MTSQTSTLQDSYLYDIGICHESCMVLTCLSTNCHSIWAKLKVEHSN